MNGRSTPVLGYLQSAVADNTAHSSIDRLLLEDEINNQPQHSMSVQDEPLEMRPEDALPIGAGVKLFRGVPKWFRGQMINEGKYVGGAPLKRYHFDRLNENTNYWIKQGIQDKTYLKNLPYEENLRGLWTTTSRPEAISMGGKKILEFDVPRSIIKDKGIQTSFAYPTNKEIGDIFLFPKGLPKKYFKKFHKGYQQGGPAERPPLLGYMNPSIQDETAHSQMDRLMFENELSQQPQHLMRSSPESLPFKMTPEDAAPIGKGARIIGNIIGGKYVPDRILKKGISDNKLADSIAEEIKELKKFIDDKGFMGYASSSEINKAKKKMKELRNSYDELRPVMKGRNFQQGGQAHRNLLMEALNQPPQYTMGVPDKPWPMPEDLIPIGGAMRLLKSSGKYLDMLKSVSKTAAKEKKNWETMTDLTRGGSKGQIKETPKEFLKWYKKGADKSGEEYLTTKWIQKILDQNPF